jgi:hypothetical protein
MLWPQILTLIFALVLVILTASVLLAYFRGGNKAADKADDLKSKFITYFPEVLDKLHTVFPMSVTLSMFATSASTNGLQFQSCSTTTTAFPNINFGGMCLMQVLDWTSYGG